MGCDIHLFIEYKHNGRWDNFGGDFNPGRNYGIFEAMAGVRGEESNAVVRPRGLPPRETLGWRTADQAFLLISDTHKIDGYCTLEQAQRWGGTIYNDEEGRPQWCDHPDWHTHSWFIPNEFEMAFNTAFLRCVDEMAELRKDKILGIPQEKVEEFYAPPNRKLWMPEYQAVLATLRAFEQMGFETRIVFWFDN